MPMVYHDGRRRAAIYAPGAYGRDEGKTGHDLVIFNGGLLWDLIAVVDPFNAGRDAGEVLGLGRKGIPIVRSIKEAIEKGAEAIIVGAAPVGGKLPEEWKRDLRDALEAGLDVYSGLHTFLSDDPELRAAAEKGNARIVDVRKPDPRYYRVWDGRVLGTKMKRVLIAGTDCDAGKNIATYTIYQTLVRRGAKACMIGTGQTMLLLGARGLVMDAMPSDFVAGALEKIIVEAYEQGCEVAVIEGQAAITHEAYGHVTLGILRGASPTHIVVAHVPGRRWRSAFSHAWMPLRAPEPGEELVYLKALNPYPNPVLAGITLNTSMYSLEEAKRIEEEYTRTYMVPAVDPLRTSVDAIVERILSS
ncbi:DUF1611 domain-containing protein [Hyperthermus butylicus]|uniref:Universally conserved protein n=1 Tax=Hyperthermus butylicus (strain DSM 5456 / JCM 9403 / PLM1-5) TaxID=415426 RepID=A2BL21_HYPBU|nr:DUF1611 domain-containing protein [Hyperthermus butylicus]ABM80682.1 universally conserved protein [Hyperthermus butylicus DSM 5456]